MAACQLRAHAPAQPDDLGVGDKVQARLGGRDAWINARVIMDYDDSTFDLQYVSGERETAVPAALVREGWDNALGPVRTQRAQVGATALVAKGGAWDNAHSRVNISGLALARASSTTAIPSLGQNSALPPAAPSPALVQAAARSRDKRGADARLSLATRLRLDDHGLSSRMNELVAVANRRSQAAVASGATPDLPGCLELIQEMKDSRAAIFPQNVGSRKRNGIIKKLMAETERRHRLASTDVLAKFLHATPKRGKAAGGYQIASITISHDGCKDKYILYKAKAKDPRGNPATFQMLVVCYAPASMVLRPGLYATGRAPIMSVMQRAHYTENAILFKALEARLHVELASVVLRRAEEAETAARRDFSVSAALRDRLAAAEAELDAVAERWGKNDAVRSQCEGRDLSTPEFDLTGPIKTHAAEVLTDLELCATAVVGLCKDAMAAIKGMKSGGRDPPVI